MERRQDELVIDKAEWSRLQHDVGPRRRKGTKTQGGSRRRVVARSIHCLLATATRTTLQSVMNVVLDDDRSTWRPETSRDWLRERKLDEEQSVWRREGRPIQVASVHGTGYANVVSCFLLAFGNGSILPMGLVLLNQQPGLQCISSF